MPENQIKVLQSTPPVARAGAGDISERELSRERCNLQTTPNARIQQPHRKKQLFLTPVNKFTVKPKAPSPNLTKIRSCIDEMKGRGVTKPMKVASKALSMEDLTPTKRCKREGNYKNMTVARVPTLHCIAEEQAAARIGRFMLVTSWRKRREDVRCLRKTLETQVSCSERLRIQVCALKSLLDCDNAKVLLAMKELDRLKQLLRDKDMEKAILEREKHALENDVCAAEDRASELSIEWRNARNELETARTTNAALDMALIHERAATADARGQRDQALATLSQVEEELDEHVDLLEHAETEVATLRLELEDKRKSLDNASELLKIETVNRERCSRECSDLKLQVAKATAETGLMKSLVDELRAELVHLERQLRVTRERLDWWPRPLTRMLGVARTWLRNPMSMSEAIIWKLLPVRHGC